MDLASLKSEARRGRLDKSARAQIVRAIGQRDAHLYELIDIAGWMALQGGPSQEEVETLEPLLDFRQDAMIPGLVLTILSSRWNLARQYAPRIRQFLERPSWDLEGHAQLAAATAAGELLEQLIDREIINLLLRIVRNPDAPSGTREAAYSALARGKGISIHEQVRSKMRLPSAQAPHDDVIDWALNESRELPDAE